MVDRGEDRRVAPEILRREDLMTDRVFFRKLGIASALILAWACMPAKTQAGNLIALASFDGTNGTGPQTAGVTFDANGNLFGTAFAGGANGQGTVWELAKGSSTITALGSFNGTNGSGPVAGVTLDASGNLFGAAPDGGAKGVGTVWELAKGSGTITAIASFNTTNGAVPLAGVTFDANGNLFGTTSGGGTHGTGTVWELAKGSSAITALASFILPGQSVYGGVTLDAKGNLFGTTAFGGASNQGTVWELAKGNNSIMTLASFNGTNGNAPHAGVTFDANGNLFGTTQVGGANSQGAVWELAKGSSTITALSSFNGTNGVLPLGGVIFDAKGNLYGTASEGGANAIGTVWELAQGSSGITALASFENVATGNDPKASVTFDANGNLFGSAAVGGASEDGTVWELHIGSSTVPEPSSLVVSLIAMALIPLVLGRFRRSPLSRAEGEVPPRRSAADPSLRGPSMTLGNKRRLNSR
jgi:uncharacterized repeat protein (TIGR03803 family)